MIVAELENYRVTYLGPREDGSRGGSQYRLEERQEDGTYKLVRYCRKATIEIEVGKVPTITLVMNDFIRGLPHLEVSSAE